MPRLLARDAELVTALVEKHGYDRTLMLSLTFRHRSEDDLRRARRELAHAFQDLQRHRAFRVFLRAHNVRKIRVLEVTAGPNGWHAHLHVLLLADTAIDEAECGPLQRTVARLWQGCVIRRMGKAHRPTLARGAKLTRCYRAS
jgi:hypothetical protein